MKHTRAVLVALSTMFAVLVATLGVAFPVLATASQTAVYTVPNSAVDTDAVPTPDGRYVMVSDYQNDKLFRFDVATQTFASSVASVLTDPYGVAVTPDSSTAVVASYASGITFVDIPTMSTSHRNQLRRVSLSTPA